MPDQIFGIRDAAKFSPAALAPVAMSLSPNAAAQPRADNDTSHIVSVSLTVNGTRHELALDPRSTLLDALRDHLDLTGTKKGCDHGQCGACTVLVDGRRDQFLPHARRHEGRRAASPPSRAWRRMARCIRCSRRSSTTTRSSAATARRDRSARPRA